MLVQMYAIHDQDPSTHGGSLRIRPVEAHKLNSEGFGIFQTINSFVGPRRLSNLKRVNAWAVDLDDGAKPDMLSRIRSGLVPTMVVETKRGYHVYFAARDAKPEHWDAVMLDRLVPFYGADPRARDMARVLRAPGYYHMKDPADPFLVTKVWEWPVAYSEQQMAAYYPDQSKEQREAFVQSHKRDLGASTDFWERVWRLDCMDFLTKLSGHRDVGGEEFTFKPVSRGNYNIYVNGKGTSCWVDRDMRIGSMNGGGPSIFQWLRWYGIQPARCVEIIKEIAPEVICSK